MKLSLILCLFLLTMCKNDKTLAQEFQGNFKGDNANIISSIILTLDDNLLKGTLNLNNQQGQISGIVNGRESTGSVFDYQTEKSYTYTMTISGDVLQMCIIFPELNNQKIELVMHRENSVNNNSISTGNKKNPALIGIWKHTEVLSSGTGGNYASFSTEYYMQFNADGTILSWTGRSAGSGYSASGQNPRDADKGLWYTEDKTLYFIDPLTSQKASTLFIVEPERLMLHNNGTDKKIFERIN